MIAGKTPKGKPKFNSAAALLVRALLIFCHGCFVLDSEAAPVSLDQARRAVNNWLGREEKPLNSKIGAQVKNARTIYDDTGRSLYHLLFLTKSGTAAAGFVIASCDDASEPIIAFSSGNRFDESPGSPLAAILRRDMTRRLDALGKKPASVPHTSAYVSSAAKAKPKWDLLVKPATSTTATLPNSFSTLTDLRVAPLVQSTWDQGSITSGFSTVACYNYYTPGSSGIMWPAGVASNYVCGCVATAMAQVMRFYQWPKVGVGNRVYPISITDLPWPTALRGGDGAGGAYSWANMPLNPQTGNATVTQCQAIGNLTHDAGLSVSMNYNQGGTGQSGAYQYNTTNNTLTGKPFGNPFTTTFKYSNAILSENRDANIGSSLITMINPGLDAGYPSILSIGGATAAHCVVCDGYGYNFGTLYHHLNMGWSGQDDVWYALPDINVPGDNFNQVNECNYNIFTSGSGEIISGRITDSGGGPINGVTVDCLYNSTVIATATTGSNGIYALVHVPSGISCKVTATNSKFTLSSQSVTTGTSSNWNGVTGNWNGQTGNVWGVNFTPASSGTSMPSFGTGANTITLSNGGSASLGSTLCTIQAAVYSNIAVYFAAAGNPSGYSATNLPPCLTLGASTGVISGTPTLAGIYSTIITATNPAGQGSAPLAFNITNPFITSGTLTTGTQGFPVSYAITESNISASYAATGLPSGLSVSPSTGMISGTPAVTGTFTVTITANALVPGQFSFADGITVDGSGNLYVTDFNSNTVRSFTGGLLKTIAGNPAVAGSTDGPVSSASFDGPDGIGMDKAGNLYLADFYNCTIRKISTTGTVSTLAGLTGVTGSANGTGSAAQFIYPNKLALDGSGNIYVADSGNNTIRKVTSTGTVTTIAGLAGVTGSANGTGTAALFNWPQAIAPDGNGNLYVSDCYNCTIRKISATGSVSTIAGSPGQAGNANGTGNAARFYQPEGLAVDGSGNIYIADNGNYTIRKITSLGVVTLLAGNPGVSGTLDGTGTSANFYGPDGLTLDGSGNLYVTDNYAIRKVSISSGSTSTLVGVPGVDGTNDSVMPCSGTLTVVILAATPCQTWDKNWFGVNASNAMTGDTVSNNAAGIPNLLCYALGLNPFTATASALPQPGPATTGNYLTLIFRRNSLAIDLKYEVQASSDLGISGGWQTVSTFNGSSWSPSTYVTETGTSPNINVTVRDTQPSGSSTHRFMRLKVTH